MTMNMDYTVFGLALRVVVASFGTEVERSERLVLWLRLQEKDIKSYCMRRVQFSTCDVAASHGGGLLSI